MYDSKGIFRETGEDLCDCLDRSCVGCHFPCGSCGATKCGVHCRCNRDWRIDEIAFDGKEETFSFINLLAKRNKAANKKKDQNNN